MSVEIRRPYDLVQGKGVDCSKDEVLVTQDFKEDCDINRIMKRYFKTGELEQAVERGVYGDFSAVDDFLSAQLLVQRSREQFELLPSKVREEFGNDPAAFLDWASTASKEDFEKRGLARKVEISPGEVMVETLKTIAVNTKPAEPAGGGK